MQRENKKERCAMAILTAKCDRAFVVADDKAESFKSLKSNPEVFRKIDAIASKLQKNITVETEK